MRRLGDVRTSLGEGPYWDASEQLLWFVDIRGLAVWRYDPLTGAFDSWPTPIEPAAITRALDRRLVVALADGLYDFDVASGAFTLLQKMGGDISQVQANDAKVDRQGRFVVGETSFAAGLTPTAAIRSYDGSKEQILDTGYTICNGPCWSPDGSIFYLADTIPNIIHAFDYDVTTGKLSNRRQFVDCKAIGGFADGATVDADGRLWMAFCGEGRIICFNPDGSIQHVVETSVKWVSSVQFGGPDLDKLYVTSFDPEKAGANTIDERSGYLYVIDDVGARGLPEPLAKI